MEKIDKDYKLVELSELQFLKEIPNKEFYKVTINEIQFNNELNKIIKNQNEIIKALLKVIKNQEDERLIKELKLQLERDRCKNEKW